MTITETVPRLVQMPIVVHNLHGPDKNKDRRHKTIRQFLDEAKGGIGGFNELNTGDRAYIKAEAAKRGLNVLIHSYNGMVWDPTKIQTATKPRLKRIMVGGYVGADGVATPRKGDDDRRVGPNRYAIYMPCEVIGLGIRFEFDVTHLMAKWTTTAKWRAKLAAKSIVSFGAGVYSKNGVAVGDMNTDDYIDLPGVDDIPVKTPDTFGRRKYDQILRWGAHIYIHAVRAINTPSDHHMLKGTITFYRDPEVKVPGGMVNPEPRPSTPKPEPTPTKPKPAIKLPKPGDSKANWKKQGAPVAHPWASRNKSWIRRHKRVWAEIGRWQAAYLRRYNAAKGN